LNTFHRPTWAEISLDAVGHNISEFRRVLSRDKKIMAVVKANAYGHGAVEVAEEAVRCGIDYLGVAFMDEAIQLRKAGLQAPVLVMGYTPVEALELARRYNVAVAVFSEEVLQALEKGASDSPDIRIHIKLDTGMGRVGVRGERESIDFIDRARAIPGVHVEGLFTHYACADETDKSYTIEQYRRFQQIVNHYAVRGIEFPLLHAGNSATGIDTPDMVSTMLRLGISLYGFYPSDEVNKERVDLRPVMSYKTKIVLVRVLPVGSAVSYGATYVTQGEERIATIPVGYGDGYTRLLNGRAHVLVRGQRVPVVGRICMDQCMINVSDIPDASVGDEVVLFGVQEPHEISADELARALGTINYEITCMVSYRVPRVYMRDHKQVFRVVNRLIE
jgi:alanine racemase